VRNLVGSAFGSVMSIPVSFLRPLSGHQNRRVDVSSIDKVLVDAVTERFLDLGKRHFR
jgi:hypothetical protein